MPSSKEKYINRKENNNNNNSQNVSNDLTNKNIYLKNNRVEGLPGIKIFLFLTFCWISDHGEKLFGLIILVPFLEIMDYLSQDFQAKMNEKPNEDTNETRPVEVADSINSNHTTENKPKNNMYVYYFLFYFISQDMFLIGNHSAFALLKYSFGFENDKTQQIKAIKVFTLLRPLFSHVTKYRYGLIILGYFLEKSIYDNNNKGEYSKDFLLRKILLGIRIGMDMIYIFYQILINVNDKLFVQLFIYSFVNISLFLMDYLGFAFTKLGRLICG
jgi:hypothetical protein